MVTKMESFTRPMALILRRQTVHPFARESRRMSNTHSCRAVKQSAAKRGMNCVGGGGEEGGRRIWVVWGRTGAVTR
jgi:hypothetical protein